MNNTLVKSFILALAIAIAVGGVLVFIKTVVAPPEDIKVEDVYTFDIRQFSNSYKPDNLSIDEAEKMLAAIIDRAELYKGDGFIEQEVCDDIIAQSSDKFSKTFVTWAMSKFNQPVWDKYDHKKMKGLIKRLQNITVSSGHRKALEQNMLKSLTDIDEIINDYDSAWVAACQTRFFNYDDAKDKRIKAETYAKKIYLRNCVKLVDSLNNVGTKLEKSRYYQLLNQVNKLQNCSDFKSKDEYDTISADVFDLIKDYENNARSVFGDKVSLHSDELKLLAQSYDKVAEDYDWPEDNQYRYER